MGVNLTPGAITTMCNVHLFSEKLKPVMQVIDLKPVQLQEDNSTERYLLVISDGSHYHYGMLAMMKNELVHSGRLQKGSIVRFTQLVYNVGEHCR
ncbi:hypothetical protein SESBI_32280 [Sesbania bispinosa]|nr:hypothetical protein SESBI_32280 [Sesbania bispinosa]